MGKLQVLMQYLEEPSWAYYAFLENKYLQVPCIYQTIQLYGNRKWVMSKWRMILINLENYPTLILCVWKGYKLHARLKQEKKYDNRIRSKRMKIFFALLLDAHTGSTWSRFGSSEICLGLILCHHWDVNLIKDPFRGWFWVTGSLDYYCVMYMLSSALIHCKWVIMTNYHELKCWQVHGVL